MGIMIMLMIWKSPAHPPAVLPGRHTKSVSASPKLWLSPERTPTQSREADKEEVSKEKRQRLGCTDPTEPWQNSPVPTDGGSWTPTCWNCGLTWKQEGGLHRTYPTCEAGPGTQCRDHMLLTEEVSLPMVYALNNQRDQGRNLKFCPGQDPIYLSCCCKTFGSSLMTNVHPQPWRCLNETKSGGLPTGWFNAAETEIVWSSMMLIRRGDFSNSALLPSPNSCHPSWGPSRRWEGKISDCRVRFVSHQVRDILVLSS